MGYDLARFQGDVDEELICPICSGVLEDPLQVSGLCSVATEAKLCPEPFGAAYLELDLSVTR